MNPETLDHFRRKLEDLLVELQQAVEAKTDATAVVQLDGSIGRISRVDAIQSQQIALGLNAHRQQSLLRVRNALEAIRRGSYGTCRKCKGPIGIERLEARPEAILCVRCAGGTASARSP